MTNDGAGLDFVCVVGTDGSGKTTQCRRLIERLQQEEHDVIYSWCKFESKLLQYIVKSLKGLFDRTGDDMSDYDTRKQKKSSILSNAFVRIPFLLFILLHYYTQVIRDVWIPLLRGKAVVCDRYVYDTIVDITVDFGYSIETARKLLSTYQRLIPSPDIVIYLEVAPEVSLERKDDIPNEEFIREKKEIYDALMADVDATTISGHGSIDEVEEEIRDVIQQY